MHSNKLFGVIGFFLILGSVVVLAEEQPKYNFGSMQPVKEIQVSPGDEAEVKLYFYNVYGNRITHISLEVSNAPEDWEIEFEPELHDTTVNVSGIIVNVTENLYVEPDNATEEIPENITEGIEYISSAVGYIPAKPVLIKIKIPDDEELGREFNVTISASASWLGQTGSVAIQQGRDFDFVVKTVAEEFEETILEREEKARIEGEGFDITGYVIENASWIGLIAVLLLVIVYLAFARKPGQGKEGFTYSYTE